MQVIFTGRSKVKARFALLIITAVLSGFLVVFRDQKCTNSVPKGENGEWPDTKEALEAHYEAFGRDWSQVQIENIKDLIRKYGVAKLKNLLDNEAKWNSSSSSSSNFGHNDDGDLTDSSDFYQKSKIEIPAFAQERFQWSSLGHFNKTKFIEDEIQNCKKTKDKVKEYEDQRQVQGLSKKEALVKYFGKLPLWEMNEIKSLNFEQIWFVGLGANKTKRIPANTTNNFGFDHPKEGHDKGRYRWVVGDHLNYRYEIKKYLGGGTYGEVLQAVDHKFDSLVAIKMLNNYTSISKHIMTEYHVVDRINTNYPNSPYFIRNIDNFKFRNHFCMVFELLGDSAYELYDEITFRENEDKLKVYVSEILKGLVLLHSIGIIHNDMKPDNLLLEQKNALNPDAHRMIKIMDFGLSCVLGAKLIKCPDYYVQTRYYRSPEVIFAIPYTQASDLWSLGVIIGEMFRGTEFIFGESEPDQLAAIMENIGLPPVYMLEQSDRKHIYYEAVCYVTEKGFHRRPYRKSITKTLQLNSPEHDLLMDFLKRLLKWDPDKRLTAEEALNHPWITGKIEDVPKLPPIEHSSN